MVCRGLSMERVIASFLKIHCVTSDPSSISLVLVINTTDQEEVIMNIVIFLEFHSTKQGLPLVDSWSRGLD